MIDNYSEPLGGATSVVTLLSGLMPQLADAMAGGE